MIRIVAKNMIERIENRFDLILIAAQRARQIQMSEKGILTAKINNNIKCTVIALKEIEKKFFTK